MIKPLIVGNWKMNPATEKEAVELFDAVKNGISDAKADVVICPPFVFLSFLKGLTLGAQNVSFQDKGAFTGEISPLQLKDLGVEYVIVGHSESRRNGGETNTTVNKKIKQCLADQLIPILCIGEDDGDDKEIVLEQQIKEGLSGIAKKDLPKVIIAYEPVWAIGTGNNCSTEETKNSVDLIRKYLTKFFGKEVSVAARILYGGSVNSANAKEYLTKGGVDGLLVGGASLKPEEFLKIVN